MSSTDIKNILDIATWVLVAFIILSAIIAGVYIKKQDANKVLIQKRRWIESLPSLISTLHWVCSALLVVSRSACGSSIQKI